MLFRCGAILCMVCRVLAGLLWSTTALKSLTNHGSSIVTEVIAVAKQAAKIIVLVFPWLTPLIKSKQPQLHNTKF